MHSLEGCYLHLEKEIFDFLEKICFINDRVYLQAVVQREVEF